MNRGIHGQNGFPLVAALVGVACTAAQAQPIRPESLLLNLHREIQQQLAQDRLMLLWDLAIAATGVDPALSAEWSLEMYDLATNAPHGLPWQQMNQLPERKNALTVLSLTDPESAARHFLELERGANAQPNEDPRIDCARNLFPRLWAKEGKQAMTAILRMADFTSRTGQYPYIGIGHILPSLGKVDPAAAHSLFLAAVHRLAEERGIWRTPDDYLQFLRESWPTVSREARRIAVEAALNMVHRGVEDKAAAMPGSRQYFEYYLAKGTVRFDSEETARVYDLLPFADDIDASWGRRLRQQYPALANVPLPRMDVRPWRSGVFAAAGHDTPERVEAAFERHHLIFLAEWSREDPVCAATIARRTKDPARRRAAIALVLPAYAKADSVRAEAWRRELMTGGFSARTSDDLTFLVALARVHFALGHPEDGRQVTGAALALGEQLAGKRDRSRPVYAAEGAAGLHDLADLYGEFQPNGLAPFVERLKEQEPPLRLYLLAGAVRGAMRHQPGYREPS
ncbi:MAG TPA: hypothetical protein VGS58_11865 [Candidatus Sulfopaludibacter sp.]|nr:hypothetical protein [Candidatus Sulfopaludibacter sp.]